VRLKPDGTLDLDWREARRPWWMKTVAEREAEMMALILPPSKPALQNLREDDEAETAIG
jgi:hypothetical protein